MNVQEIKDNIFKSSIIGIARVIIAIPLYLILTPFVLNRLGVEDFAIWSFSTIIISLISLGDFGFKNSLIYHIAQNIKFKNKQNIYFNNALLIFIVIAVSIIIFTALFSPYFSSHILEVPSERVDKTIFVLSIIAVSFAFRLVATPYQAIIEAHHKIYYSHYVMISWLVSNFIFTIIALNISSSIYYLAIASILPNILVLLMYYRKIKKEYKYIRLNLSLLTMKYIIEMLRYGSGIHIATIAIATREPILKILIAKNTDLIAVTIFELSYRLCIQAISLVKTPLLSVFSASAALSKDNENLNKIITPFCNYNIAFLIPSAVFFFTFASELINFWLGENHERTAEILPFMFLSLSIYYLTEPLYKTIEASGKSYYSALIQSIVIISCIVLYRTLNEYEYFTSVYVLLISFSIFSLINLISFHVFFSEIKTFSYLKSSVLFMLAISYIVSLPTEGIFLKFTLFITYLLIHFSLCKVLKLFDIVYTIKKILGLRRSN